MIHHFHLFLFTIDRSFNLGTLAAVALNVYFRNLKLEPLSYPTMRNIAFLNPVADGVLAYAKMLVNLFKNSIIKSNPKIPLKTWSEGYLPIFHALYLHTLNR
jgi:hypothetical protein